MGKIGPSETGQAALLPLPSKSLANRRIENYSLPSDLVEEKTGLKSNDHGMEVLKVTKNGKLQPRRIAITKDRRNVVVTTNKIKSVRGLLKAATGREASAKILPVCTIDRIQRGCNTERFWNVQGDPKVVKKLMENTIDTVSIIYFSFETHALESLDLIVPDPVAFEKLYAGLEDLTSLAKEERLRLTRSIHFLHYQWALRQKKISDGMSVTEFTAMIESIGTTITKSTLTEMFKEDCQMHNVADRLPLAAVGMLLEDVREVQMPRENPIESIWNHLIATDPIPALALDGNDNDSVEVKIKDEEETISSVVFLSFVRSRQKQYETTLDQVTELVRTLNSQQTPEQLMDDSSERRRPLGNGDRLPKSRFLSYLQSDHNDLMIPRSGKIGYSDMTKPLSSYWINTSHDTYLRDIGPSLGGNKTKYVELGGSPEELDGQAYLTALYRGVRCLEMDVWEDTEGNPVVSRFKPTEASQSLPLLRVLRLVRHFLQVNPYSFPIIFNIENHCTSEGQLRVSKLLYSTLGSSRLIVEPETALERHFTLPSPEDARGKVIIMGKRPKLVQSGAKVINDDYDDENYILEHLTAPKGGVSFDNDREILGFNSLGPIFNKDPHAFVPSPTEIYDKAAREANDSQTDAQTAREKADSLEKAAESKDKETSKLTSRAGISAKEVSRRAAAAAGRHHRGLGSDDESEVFLERQPEEEGVELHEILPDFVAGGQNRYARATQEVTEAGNRVAHCFTRFNEADTEYQEALANVERAKQREKELQEEAKKAASEARTHREFADTARTRLETVRELQRTAEENSSSAGNVVVTAMTEAKISEKRAKDAEARAVRAKGVAEKDKKRADAETRREEQLENEVNKLHVKSGDAAEAAKEARHRVEKAAAMLDRVNEQVLLIENSSQYQKEVAAGVKIGNSSKHGSSFVAKHAAKMEERETCRELIKEASAANAAAESKLNKIYVVLEEKNRAWREQSDVASQARKVADRSSHVADDLLETAEEEREAAELRLTARKKAEETVLSQETQTGSLQTQLLEAERASSEAANVAVQSRKRATALSSKAEQAKNHEQFFQLLKDAEWKRNQTKGEYDSAVLEKERKDKIAMEEKRRLETNEQVANQARIDAAQARDRIKTERLYEEEAVVAFNEALSLRAQAEDARRRAKAATAKAEEKVIAAKRARDYKQITDRVVEIPTNLARFTLLHRIKFEDWDTSLRLSNCHTHSFSQNALFEMVSRNPADERSKVRSFTKNHLLRCFPSWEKVLTKTFTNYDPIFAWSLGCQMVAMNYHSVDERAFVADGRFRSNGSCGYVLKPKTSADPEKWTFEILCGFHIPNLTGRPPQLSVKISLFAGSTRQDKSAFFKTPVTKLRSHPVWAGHQEMLFTVDNPAVAIWVFSVWDADTMVGAYSVPVSCTREGVRSIPLFDTDYSRKGPFAFATLLVEATKLE